MRVLFVEDERYIAEAVERVLKKNNYSVDLAFDGEYGLDCALTGIYDIIILDITLPGMDGLSILKHIREQQITAPVLLLTARGQVEDKVRGLDLGADDYLAKPFHKEELLARLRALSRRGAELIPDGIQKFGCIELNTNTLTACCLDNQIRLSPKEAQILELLIKNRGIAVSKEGIIEKIWGYDSDADDRNVETHISLLRRKLSELTPDIQIRTIRGIGYMLAKGTADKTAP